MAFDPSTAKPVSFDPATAKPYKPSSVPSKANDYNVFGYANAVNNPALNRDIQIAKDAVSTKKAAASGGVPASLAFPGINPAEAAIGETVLKGATGLASMIPAGIAGIAKAAKVPDWLKPLVGATPEGRALIDFQNAPGTADQTISKVENALTYEPRTILGKQFYGAGMLPLTYLSELQNQASQAIMNPKESLVPAGLRAPAAAVVGTAIQSLPFMLGGKAGDATEAAPVAEAAPKTAPEAPITPVEAQKAPVKPPEAANPFSGLRPKDSQKTAPVAPQEAPAPVNDTMAQVNDLKAPDSKRQAVFIPKADVTQLEQSGDLHNVLKSGTPVDNFDGQGGLLLAKTPEIAQEATKARDAGTAPDQVIGNLTQSGEAVKPPETQKPPESASNVPPETQSYLPTQSPIDQSGRLGALQDQAVTHLDPAQYDQLYKNSANDTEFANALEKALREKSQPTAINETGFKDLQPGTPEWMAYWKDHPAEQAAMLEHQKTLQPDLASTAQESAPRTPQDVLDELRASGKTGQQIADLAGKNGLVELHPNMVTADLNIHPSLSDQAHLAGGVYSPRTDTIKLMSENIPQGNALGVALHEMTHARLKDLMGENEYNRAITDIMDLADKGDPVAKAAMDRIPEKTPAKSRGDELLAYTVQEAVDRGATKVHGRIRQIVMRLLNALRTRIAATRFYKAAANRGVRLKITPEALAAYARRAVDLEHGKQGINAPESGAAEPLYSIPKDLSDHEKLLSQAKDAISKGAPLDAVHAILKERGVDPALLGTHGMDRPEQIANPVSPKVDLTEEDYSNLVKATKQGFVGKVKAEMKDFDRVWQKYFPRLDTEQKKIFAGVIQRAFSRKEIHEAQLFQKLWDLRGEFAKMGEAGNIAWRDKFQKGDKSLPHAKFVRDVLQKLYHAETEAGATMGYRENYFPDKYENQGNYETWIENDWVKGHAAGFQKEKLFPTISEAMQAGFKPLYPNVMDALMVRVHEDGIIRSRLQVLNDLMRMGHIRPYPRTDEEALAAGIKKGPDEVPFTTKDFGRYLVPSQALPILDNGLFAHSWWEEDSPTGKIFRGWMRFKNPVIAGRLGASAYHLTHEVLGLRSANGMANAFDAYRRGVTKPAIDKFVKSLMLQASSLGETNPHSLIRIRAALVGGHDYLPALVKAAFPKEKLGDMTPEERTIFQMIVEGGLPIELSREYRSDVAKLMKAAFQDKKVAKGAMLLPFATLRATQVPIMDWVVPNLKILAYIDGARQILHAHPDLMDNEPKRLKLLGELTRNVEKRFGQMSYDRLFWNKRFKEVMQGTFLSFSWNYGFLNQFGGGLKDVGKGALMLPFKEGRKANPIFTNRAAFALSYTTTAMALAGLMHWYFSGKAPSTIKDLVYPVCGHDAQGAEIRCTTPYFTRDMGSLYFHTKRNGPISGLANEAVNKLSPVLSMLGDQIRNENYYGQQISDPYASLGEQVAQRAKAFADSFVPISVEGAKRGGNFGLAFAGFNPAPKYATEGDTLAAIYDAYDTYVATTKPYPEALQAHAWKNLRELYQSGDMEAFKRQLSDDIKKYQWSSGSVNGFLKGFSEPQGFHIFSELPPSVKRHIFLNVMNAKERAEYWKAFGRSGFKGATPKEAQEILNLHKEAAHG